MLPLMSNFSKAIPLSRKRCVSTFCGGTCLALAILSAACAQGGSLADQRAPTQTPAVAPMSQIPNFAALVKRVMPAVVSVVVVKKADRTSDDEDTSLSLLDESLRRFFERQGEEGVPVLPRLRRVTQGSGFIIDPAGYVVTDDHVIAGGSRITVVFQ